MFALIAFGFVYYLLMGLFLTIDNDDVTRSIPRWKILICILPFGLIIAFIVELALETKTIIEDFIEYWRKPYRKSKK